MAVKEKKIASAAAPAGLREGWRAVRFDEMAQLVNDRVDNPSEAGVERYVGLEHLDPESLKIRRWGSPDDVEAQKLRFQPGDIIFGKRRAYQRKLAVADFEGICSAHAMVLRAREETVVKDFLPFFMQSDIFFDRALSISVGSLSPTINWKTLASERFTIPPEDEQHRIADILRATDDTASSYENIVESLKGLRQIVLSELISRGLEKWQFVNLSTVCINGTQNGLYKPASAYGSGVEMVHMGDLFGNDVLTNGNLKRVQLTTEEISSHGLNEGDLLFARRSIVFEGAGKCSVIGNLSEPLVFESSMISIQPNRERVRPEFLMLWFQSPSGKKAMSSITRRGSIAGIAASDLPGMKVPLPTLQEQNQISKTLEAIDKNKENYSRERANLLSLRSALCNTMLSK